MLHEFEGIQRLLRTKHRLEFFKLLLPYNRPLMTRLRLHFFLLGGTRSCNFIMTGSISSLPPYTREENFLCCGNGTHGSWHLNPTFYPLHHCLSGRLDLEIFGRNFGSLRGLHSTEVAYLLLTQQSPGFDSYKILRGKNFQCC